MTAAPPFPVARPGAADAARSGFLLHAETGPTDRRFHFGLPLPDGWAPRGVAGESPSRENPLAILARYGHPDAPGAEIVVTGRLLSRDVAPADLLLSEVERSGEEVLRHREVETEDGRSIDVLTRRRTGSVPLVLRRFAVKRGNRMLVHHAAANEESWRRWAERLAVSAAGLRFAKAGTWHCAEALGTLSRKEPSDFLLFYPDSWKLEEPVVATPGVLSATLASRSQGQVVGRLDLAVLARSAAQSPRALADDYVRNLVAAGFEVRAVKVLPLPPPAAFEEAWEGVGEASSKDARVELRLRVGRRPEAWFCFGVMGPARRTAPEVWAVNRRALEVAFDFVATPDAPVQGWIAEAIERSSATRRGSGSDGPSARG